MRSEKRRGDREAVGGERREVGGREKWGGEREEEREKGDKRLADRQGRGAYGARGGGGPRGETRKRASRTFFAGLECLVVLASLPAGISNFALKVRSYQRPGRRYCVWVGSLSPRGTLPHGRHCPKR